MRRKWRCHGEGSAGRIQGCSTSRPGPLVGRAANGRPMKSVLPAASDGLVRPRGTITDQLCQALNGDPRHARRRTGYRERGGLRPSRC